MSIEYLEPKNDGLTLAEVARGGADGSDHPMRVVTRESAREPNSWTSDRAASVAGLFNDLASEWHTRHSDERLEALKDALQRGTTELDKAGPDKAEFGKAEPGLAIEVGSGDGFATATLQNHFRFVVAVDIALEMLVRSPPVAPRIWADGSQLPMADNSASSVVLMNALLFPAEVDRVLAEDGTVVWLNSRGPKTPIHLTAEDVTELLPGWWEGFASSYGEATWAVVKRAAGR